MHVTWLKRVSGCLLMGDCPVWRSTGDSWPVWRITDDRKIAVMRVVTEKSLVRWQRGWVTGSLGGSGGPRCGGVADCLHGRTVIERKSKYA